MRNEGGGFAANIYGAMLGSSVQVTSHQLFGAPNPSSLCSNFSFIQQKSDVR